MYLHCLVCFMLHKDPTALRFEPPSDQAVSQWNIRHMCVFVVVRVCYVLALATS